MTERIGVAVVGCGRAGLVHARNLAGEAVRGAYLGAVSDPSDEALAGARSELGVATTCATVEQALDAPGVAAVVVAAPTAGHRAAVVAAARAGKHVLCEKPMAMDVGECRDMIQAVGDGGVILQIGFMRRFDPRFTAAYERIEAGEIGDVILVKSSTYGPSTPKPWMYDLAKSNGPLAEVNSHDIDTLRWFTGGEFEGVYAVGGNYRCDEARQAYPDFYDNVAMVASFDNGMQGMISGAQGVGYGYDVRCEVLGTKGVLHVDPSRSPDGISPSWRDLFAESYREELRAFVQCIRDGNPPRVTGRDGLEAVRVVEAGNRSIRLGQRIVLERAT